MTDEQAKAFLLRMGALFPAMQVTRQKLEEFRSFALKCEYAAALVGLQRYHAQTRAQTPDLEDLAKFIARAPRAAAACSGDYAEFCRRVCGLPEGTPAAKSILLYHRREYGRMANVFGPASVDVQQYGVGCHCRRELVGVGIDAETAAMWAGALGHGDAIWKQILDACELYTKTAKPAAEAQPAGI